MDDGGRKRRSVAVGSCVVRSVVLKQKTRGASQRVAPTAREDAWRLGTFLDLYLDVRGHWRDDGGHYLEGVRRRQRRQRRRRHEAG